MAYHWCWRVFHSMSNHVNNSGNDRSQSHQKFKRGQNMQYANFPVNLKYKWQHFRSIPVNVNSDNVNFRFNEFLKPFSFFSISSAFSQLEKSGKSQWNQIPDKICFVDNLWRFYRNDIFHLKFIYCITREQEPERPTSPLKSIINKSSSLVNYFTSAFFRT